MNKEKGTLPVGLKLLIIPIFACFMVGLGIVAGIVLAAGISYVTDSPSKVSDDIGDIVITITGLLLVAGVELGLLIVLSKDYVVMKGIDRKTITFRWYLDKWLMSLVPSYIMTAIIVIACASEDVLIFVAIGVGMILSTGFLIIPNIVGYAIKDMKNWQTIFTDNGNLEAFKDDNKFYKIQTPVDFEPRIVLVTIKEYMLNFGTVVSILVVGGIVSLLAITFDSMEESGSLAMAITSYRPERADGFFFFLLVAVVVFGVPYLFYLATNAIIKLKTIMSHQYIAYHAVVHNVNGYRLYIDYNQRHYEYDYCTLVGISDSKMNNREAILIFLPDDVFVFPDE